MVNLRYAKYLATLDSDFRRRFPNSTHVELKVFGDLLSILDYHSSILLAQVKNDFPNYSNKKIDKTFENYSSFTDSIPAQRVFKIKMNFPTSVLCNEAGQGVLKQKVRNAVNSLNRDWNFCSFSFEGKVILFNSKNGKKFLFI